MIMEVAAVGDGMTNPNISVQSTRLPAWSSSGRSTYDQPGRRTRVFIALKGGVWGACCLIEGIRRPGGSGTRAHCAQGA
jgi:hypothetical protein